MAKGGRTDLVAGEQFAKEVKERIGLILRNASFFDFSPVDAEEGVFTLIISVAGKPFFKVVTKLSEDKNKLMPDKWEVDEVALKAMLEWLDDKYVALIKTVKSERGGKKNEGLADALFESTAFGEE